MNLLIRIGVKLASAAIGLIIAAAALDQFNVSKVWFPWLVVIFTVIMTVVEFLTRALVERHARQAAALIGLIATFFTLLITDIFSDSLSIEGFGTWILGTLIVWFVMLVADMVLDRIFGEERREARAR